jgi:hypothetical protein
MLYVSSGRELFVPQYNVVQTGKLGRAKRAEKIRN